MEKLKETERPGVICGCFPSMCSPVNTVANHVNRHGHSPDRTRTTFAYHYLVRCCCSVVLWRIMIGRPIPITVLSTFLELRHVPWLSKDAASQTSSRHGTETKWPLERTRTCPSLETIGSAKIWGHGLPTNYVIFFWGEGCGEQVLGGFGGSSFGQQNKGMVISCSGARVFSPPRWTY